MRRFYKLNILAKFVLINRYRHTIATSADPLSNKIVDRVERVVQERRVVPFWIEEDDLGEVVVHEVVVAVVFSNI